MCHSLLKVKTVHVSKFKDSNLNVAKIAKIVFDRVENIVGKGKKC